MPLAAPPSLTRLAARVDARLEALLGAERDRWAGFDPDLAGPVQEVGRLVLSGGKRLRPAFCHWGFVAAGGDPDDQRIVDAGAAFELMHAFALFHDDVMDDAPTRRGVPTTHAVYASEHAAGEWAGEARRFGEGVAILVGDLAFVYADHLLQGAPPEVWTIWNELRLELNIGQFLDILGSVQRVRSLDKAERISRYKSGKYTIERPLHLGAVLADPRRGQELLPGLSAYGLPLGDAFQMRDDVLGAFGDEAVTGKPVGGDLRAGKPTPLLARAVARATPAQRQVLDRVGTPGMTDADVVAIQATIRATGALDELEQQIELLTAEAIDALGDLDVSGEVAAELTALAFYVTGRRT